jgi:hypothetical protein
VYCVYLLADDVYCVYLLAAGGGIAYAGSPGGWRRGCGDTSVATPLRPAEASGPTPPTFWRAQGADRWRSHGRRGCIKPTGRPTPRRPPPRGRGSLPTHPPGGTSHKPRSTSRSARRRPAGMNAPSPAAEAQAQCQDVGRGERRRPARAERCRSRRLRTRSSASRLCPAAWAYDLQVQTCRYFLTRVVRPVSLYLWGSMCGGRGGLRGVKSL